MTISYSNSGVPLWTNRYKGPGNAEDSAYAIAVDASGNVFVTGISPTGCGVGAQDYATVAYSNGGVPLWTNRYNGPGNSFDYGRAIAVDGNGNVFVTGASTGVDGWGDYATIAYSNSGVPLWTNRYDRGGEAEGIAVDSSGNIFVTGGTGGRGLAYATIKYSILGAPVWSNLFERPTNPDAAHVAIAVDSSGTVFVTGYSATNATPPYNIGYTTIAYSNSCVPLWTNRYNDPNPNGPAVALTTAADSNGNVFVTGYSYGTNSSDYATIKYSSSAPPPRLDFQVLNNQLVLSWTNAGFNLQSAPALIGPFTDLAGATSPYTNAFTTSQQFFRLKEN